MAQVAKFLDVSLATPAIGYEHTNSGLLAGEQLNPGDAVAISDDDNKVYRAGGTADPEASGFFPQAHGFVGLLSYTDQAVTILDEVRMHYAEELTPGTKLYLSATTRGGLADTPPWEGASPVGYAVDPMRVLLRSNWQLPIAIVP